MYKLNFNLMILIIVFTIVNIGKSQTCDNGNMFNPVNGNFGNECVMACPSDQVYT